MFTGAVAETRRHYRVIDVAALSSDTEQMPMTVLEAMASGLPCLTTSVGDCAEILAANGEPVVVPPGNEAAYISALRTLAANREERIRLGLANRERCREHYSLEKMLARYDQLYLAAASSRGA